LEEDGVTYGVGVGVLDAVYVAVLLGLAEVEGEPLGEDDGLMDGVDVPLRETEGLELLDEDGLDVAILEGVVVLDAETDTLGLALKETEDVEEEEGVIVEEIDGEEELDILGEVLVLELTVGEEELDAVDEIEFVTEEVGLDDALDDVVMVADGLVDGLGLELAVFETEVVEETLAVGEILEELEDEILGEMVDDPELETVGEGLEEDDEVGLVEALGVTVGLEEEVPVLETETEVVPLGE
jgi:hypothetical protein